MNQKTIAGIDYSLTPPAICVYEEVDDRYFDFDRCMLYYLFNNKRQQQLSTGCGIGNIFAHPYPEWSTEEERHEKLSAWTMTLIQGCDEVFIEGYAFATSGKSHVRSVAENSGLLKHKMYKAHQTFTSIPPSVIKKYATGKGNANKDLMYDAFSKECVAPVGLQKTLRPKSNKLTNPTTDIVDSYWICKYGWRELLA